MEEFAEVAIHTMQPLQFSNHIQAFLKLLKGERIYSGQSESIFRGTRRSGLFHASKK
jgi:hypothetical protein